MGINNLITNTVTISFVSSNQYRINGLATLTDAPGNYLLTLDTTGIEDRAGNGGATILSNAWQRLGINSAPQLVSIPNQSIPEGNLLTFTVAATDADIPTNVLTFSLEAGAPSGAAIDANTGVFTWTPTELQGPGFASVTVRVSDNGVPGMSTTRSFFITVSEVNEPPALAGITNQATYVGTPLNVLNFASDPDLPTNQLTFTLAAGAPAGARIHPTRARSPGHRLPPQPAPRTRSPSLSPTTETRPSPTQSHSPSSSAISSICLSASPSCRRGKRAVCP